MGYFGDNPEVKSNTIVPEYRAIVGLWNDDYGRPLMIKDPNLAFINELRLRQGVTELEGIAAGTGPVSMREMDYADHSEQPRGRGQYFSIFAQFSEPDSHEHQSTFARSHCTATREDQCHTGH
jgi:hypothetical protein